MMMNKLRIIISLFRYLFMTLSIMSFLTYSYLNSSKSISHELLNSNIHDLLFSSHLNDHNDSQDTQAVTSDDETDHVHKHRHNENEEEHSHKHINLVSFSEIVINKSYYILFHPTETNAVAHFAYNIKPYNSYILEVLKPPIHS